MCLVPRVGKAGDHPDAGCLSAHHRRPLADHATLHPAGTRSSPDAPPAQSVLAFTTATSHQGPGGAGTDRAADIENVVPTFENPLLKTNHLPLSYPLNCESSVRVATCEHVFRFTVSVTSMFEYPTDVSPR